VAFSSFIENPPEYIIFLVYHPLEDDRAIVCSEQKAIGRHGWQEDRSIQQMLS
jgi:hypothetical protein